MYHKKMINSSQKCKYESMVLISTNNMDMTTLLLI